MEHFFRYQSGLLRFSWQFKVRRIYLYEISTDLLWWSPNSARFESPWRYFVPHKSYAKKKNLVELTLSRIHHENFLFPTFLIKFSVFQEFLRFEVPQISGYGFLQVLWKGKNWKLKKKTFKLFLWWSPNSARFEYPWR